METTHRHSRGQTGRRTFSSNSNRPQRRSGGRPSSTHSGSRGSFNRGRGGNSGGGRGRQKRAVATFDPSQFINKNPVEATPEVYTATHTFSTIGLDQRLVRTLTAMDITEPSAIQDQAIPHILEGKDVVGLAQTGTGKTAAFLLPLIHRIKAHPKQQVLILTPTRELALQIEAEFKKLTKDFRLFATTCVGGTNIRPQINALRRFNHMVIGTPGRIMDLMDRRALRTDAINTIVLDEADRMLDMGFVNDMRTILATLATPRQTLFFSATMNDAAKRLVSEFMVDPITISVKKKDVTNSIAQDVVKHGHHNKFETLCTLLEDPKLKRVIIFGAMKHSVEKLSEALNKHGVKAESIHGNKSHGQRQRALSRFKSGNARVLVATDVAARGIHVDDVTHVINYDLPQTFEDYVHRIGRTGRANANGQALTFITG